MFLEFVGIYIDGTLFCNDVFSCIEFGLLSIIQVKSGVYSILFSLLSIFKVFNLSSTSGTCLLGNELSRQREHMLSVDANTQDVELENCLLIAHAIIKARVP